MKKYFLPLLLLLPLAMQAQSIKGPYIGVTTQYQNTWIINDEQYEDVNYRHKFTTKWAPFGVVAGYKFNENHNFQVELIRSKQGENFDFVDDNGDKTGEKEIDLVYWNIPVLFKYTTTGRLRFNFHVGPQLSILQKGREENRFSRDATYDRNGSPIPINAGTYVLATTDEAERNRNNSGTPIGGFNKYDLGIALGTGVEYSLNSATYLTANIRYHYNFVNIRDSESQRSPVDPDYYVLRQNMVVGLQLGIHFLFNTGDGETPARHK
ncbi:porin family protein [Rufibacter roseus]|uniref:Porin family protein n=1 Tax=Rufibacter roseus TaxID=1567108 RepID=A0ABW2DIP6_9BACT|nr:porin family protein [Rufibacter roseus]